MNKTIHIDMPIGHFENLLWILAEWGNQPATHKESVTAEQFNELYDTLRGATQ
jgi:hypothetical protein